MRDQSTADNRDRSLSTGRRDLLRGASATALLAFAGTGVGAATEAAESKIPVRATEGVGRVLWYRQGDNDGREQFRDAVSTDDSGVVTSGVATATAERDDQQAWQYRWHHDGTREWARRYGQTRYDTAAGVTNTADGGFILCGHSETTTTEQVYVVETGPNGDATWTRRLHVAAGTDDRGYDVVQTDDGGYAIAGVSGDEALLVKLTAEGETAWTRTYGGGESTEFISVIQTNSGFVLAGTVTLTDGRNEFLLIGTDGEGTERWRHTYTDGADDRLVDCVQTDGGFLLAGTTTDAEAFTSDALFVQTTPSGVARWTQTYGREGEEYTAAGVTAVADGFVFVGTRSEDVVGPQLWLGGFDGQGKRTWNYSFGTERKEVPYGITTTRDGHVAVCGYTNPEQFGDGNDGFVAKVCVPESLG